MTGRYVWSGGEAVYTDWARNQPENGQADIEDCVWKSVSQEAWRGWHDAACGLTYWEGYGDSIHALCEVNAV